MFQLLYHVRCYCCYILLQAVFTFSVWEWLSLKNAKGLREERYLNYLWRHTIEEIPWGIIAVNGHFAYKVAWVEKKYAIFCSNSFTCLTFGTILNDGALQETCMLLYLIRFFYCSVCQHQMALTVKCLITGEFGLLQLLSLFYMMCFLLEQCLLPFTLKL